MENPLLLTVEQAAEELGLGRTTVFSLIKDGDLKSVKVRRHRRILRTDLEEYVERLRSAA